MLYEKILQTIQDGFWLVSFEGRLLKANSAYLEMSGYGASELLKMNMAQLEVAGEGFSAVGRFKKKLQKEPSIFQSSHKRKDGSIFKVEISTCPLPEENQIIAIIKDITERDNAIKIFHAAPVGLMLVDENLTISRINKAADAMIFSDQEKLIGKRIGDAIRCAISFENEKGCGFSKACLKCKIQKLTTEVLTKGRSLYGIEINKLIHLDIIPQHRCLNINFEYIEIDNKQYVVIGINDVSELKQTQAQLLALNQDLEGKVKDRTAELEKKTTGLEETNTALKVLLDKREQDRIDFEGQVVEQINRLILPYAAKLESTRLDANQKALVEIIHTNLTEIGSSFSQNLSELMLLLTPAEATVSTMIKQGMSSKEIAGFLNLSVCTVDSHRKKIRAKFGLANKNINLQTFLISKK